MQQKGRFQIPQITDFYYTCSISLYLRPYFFPRDFRTYLVAAIFGPIPTLIAYFLSTLVKLARMSWSKYCLARSTRSKRPRFLLNQQVSANPRFSRFLLLSDRSLFYLASEFLARFNFLSSYCLKGLILPHYSHFQS